MTPAPSQSNDRHRAPGCTGGGKGTQAQALSGRLGIPVLASGDLLRAAVAQGSALGREADRYMSAVSSSPTNHDPDAARPARGRGRQSGAILDGFPRKVAQAAVLDSALAERDVRVDRALYIEVPADDLAHRLSAAGSAPADGHVYNRDLQPARAGRSCDVDGSPLIQRSDDVDAIRTRLAVQLAALAEVVEHYRRTGVLRTVDGRGSIDEVADDLLAAVTDDPVGAT